MDLSIIIVNYKSKDKLRNCLSFLKEANLSGINFEVILVENNSGEDLTEFLSFGENVKLVISNENLGMGRGNNLGIENSSGEYILILNPDTVIKDKAILTLINYLRANSQVGLIGPKLLYPDKSLQLSCSRFPTFFIPVLRRTFLGDYFKKIRDSFTMSDFDHNSVLPVDWLMGSCLMFKRCYTLENGKIFCPKFDDRYFMYFEDIDLARSIKEEGLEVIYNPEAIVIHDHARQSAKHAWYLAIFKDKLTWVHITSWLKYFIKWGFKNKNKYKN